MWDRERGDRAAMGYYESRSEFDGFDNSNSVQAYDDKKEKRFQADIWILLSIFFVGIFLTNCYRHAHEQQLLQNGTCIEAEYFGQQGRASYIDSDGKWWLPCTGKEDNQRINDKRIKGGLL